MVKRRGRVSFENLTGAKRFAFFILSAKQQDLAFGKLPSVEAVTVRHLMLQEGLTIRELAKRSGIPPRSLTAELCAGVPSEPTRFKIERGFDYRYPIWSDPKTLALRHQCVQVFGFDPELISVLQLKKLAPTIGLDFSNCVNKADYVRECFARACVRKPLKEKIHEQQRTD